MAQLKQLKQNNENIYPVTIGSAVYMSDGSTLDSKLDNPINNYNSISNPLVDGSIYQLGTVSSISLNIPNPNTKGIAIYFTSGTGGCTISYPNNTPWIGETNPSCKASSKYVITIIDGVCKLDIYTNQSN